MVFGQILSKITERILHFYNFFWYIYMYMYLCCVESLSWFQSKLDFLWIFKVAQKLGIRPCTIVQGLWSNFAKNEKERILHFYYIFWYIYMHLCCVESFSWFRSKLDFLWIFKVAQKLGQRPCTIVEGLWSNFAKNEKERILHFYYIFWYTYMYLCCVESLSWFWSKLDFLWIFKVAQKSGQKPCTIVHGLGPNFAKNEKERILYFYYIFRYTYMYLCCVETLSWFWSKLDFLWIFKVTQKLGQRPCTIYSTGSLVKFCQKWKGENSLFLLHFPIHIHVLMLCRNFELILIKIGFFMNF